VSTEIPVLAVSTAIRVIPKPHIWVCIDNITHHHGKRAFDSARDPYVQKVVPDHAKFFWEKFPNMEFVTMHGKKELMRNKERTERQVFDGLGGVIRSFNRSMTFAVQWAFNHYNCLIFCGMDHDTKPDVPYVYDEILLPKICSVQNKNHRKELAQLIAWKPIVLSKGMVWLNWCPPESPMATVCHGEFDGYDTLDSVFGVALGAVPGVEQRG